VSADPMPVLFEERPTEPRGGCYGARPHKWGEATHSPTYGCVVQCCPTCSRVRRAPDDR